MDAAIADFGKAAELKLDQVFPDELPPEYAARYGAGRLHDTYGPALDEGTLEQSRAYAGRAIEALKKQTQDVWRWT